MSVPARERKETPLQFVVTAQEIQVEVTKIVMSEKSMPKKYRVLIGASLIAKADELMDNVIAANSIYAINEEKLARRHYYQDLAVINCRQIESKLIRIEKCIPEFKVNRLAVISELLKKEVSVLKRWSKSDKISA